MNYSVIFYIIGWILVVEAALMTPSGIVAILYRETCGWAFAVTMAVCLLIGLPLIKRQPQNKVFYIKEGSVTVALSWIVMSIMGSLPFVLSGAISNPIDALFETVSGFTTTGSSILGSLEELPRCILFWRSFTHWVGGMGVLVFLLCLLPLTGGGYHMNLMKAESPGPSVSKLVPKVQATAKLLYSLYLFLTVFQFILLVIGRMPLFDAICLTFGTAGTGGFGVRSDSMASYTIYQQAVTTVFMILFGINFNVYFLFYMKKPKEALKCEEARWYLSIIGVSILVITFFIRKFYGNLAMAFHHAAFQVATIITTTGFATADFDLWASIPKTILVLLMMVGACAGSTGGGMKVSRVVLLGKSILNELHQTLHPNMVRKISFEGHVVEQSTLRSLYAFLAVYVLIFAGSTLLIGIDNYDLTTNFTAVAATLNNIGPGLSLVGPTQSFAHFSYFSKLVFIFDMLAGRLEIFPMLLLFHRDTWRKF